MHIQKRKEDLLLRRVRHDGNAVPIATLANEDVCFDEHYMMFPVCRSMRDVNVLTCVGTSLCAHLPCECACVLACMHARGRVRQRRSKRMKRDNYGAKD